MIGTRPGLDGDEPGTERADAGRMAPSKPLPRIVFAVGLAALLAVGGCGSTTLPGVGRPAGPAAGGSDGTPSGPLGAADGVLPDSISVDTDTPAITKLQPELRRALQAAATAARDDRGVEIRVTSGWRSARYQQSLYDDAVRKYGSEAEARRTVADGATSEHVRGEAVDVGPTDAADWMTRFGEDYGLCRVYANEMWHFEAKTGGQCAPMVDDAASRSR